ncbi:MAG: hypothetical protein L6R36_004731 [Xanthoria steineri]|nr:MAG: hypothetical protein L6R36_004731 [Xanthoria steineri]
MMDYFIDDILDASARRSKKSVLPTPAAPEPPLPPSPSAIRRKKTKSVKFPEGRSSSAAGSPKLLEPPIVAAIPLPDTPAPSTDVPTAIDTEAPPEVVPEAVLGKSDYFPVAELSPPEEPHLRPGLFGFSHTGGSAYFSPMSELPPPVAEKSQAIEELPVPDDHLTEPASAAEEPGPGGITTALEDTPKDVNDIDVPPMIHVAHQTVPTVHSQGAMLIGISGAPSSGKTTLAHLLSAILPPTIPSFIIHQDDFLIPNHLMIPPANGELATHRHTADLSAFKRFVEYSKDEGRPPPTFRSMQPVNGRERAVSRMPADLLDQLSCMVAGMPSIHGGRSIGIVEGDLLYHSETIRSLLDIKILLRASREDARARRFAEADDRGAGEERKFWDTKEYFERTLWPHYSNEHAILFDRADVDGRPKSRICDNAGIRVQPMLNMSLEQALRWMVDVICRESEEVTYLHDREMASSIDRMEALEFCSCNEGFLGKIRQTIFDFL